MLNRALQYRRFHEAESAWVRSLSVAHVKCLIVCRGPVRMEAMNVFDAMGIREYGILLSEKDSVVYPKCLAPELRGFKYPNNIHRIPDYVGAGAEEKQRRIEEIVGIGVANGYTHLFAGYGFMAEDAEFIAAIERAGLSFIGPASRVQRAAGAKDEAKKLARRLGVSVTPGVDDVVARALVRQAKDREGLAAIARSQALEVAFDDGASVEENAERLLLASYARGLELVDIAALQREAAVQCESLWSANPGRRLRLKYIGGGGGKGQRVVERLEEVESAVYGVLSESKVTAPGSNRNFLIELNVEETRHNEVQLIGNGQWCLSLGARDCSLQMHEQKLLELSLTRELLEAELGEYESRNPAWAATLRADLAALAIMEDEAERFGAAVGLDSVSTFELIVTPTEHYFMEMNTRIQVEHRVTEMAYRLAFSNPDDPSDTFELDSLIEAMVLLAVHGPRLPKPRRVPRYGSGVEARVNATNAALAPHAGGTIIGWSQPLPGELRDDQGIGLRNPDTGAFIHYHLAGAYDSNIALLVTSGQTRRDSLAAMAEVLRRMELRGQDLQTNLAFHYGLVSFILGLEPWLKPSTQFVTHYLCAVGALARAAQETDFYAVANELLRRQPDDEAKAALKRKEALVPRVIERLWERPHLFAGFLGLYRGKHFRAVAPTPSTMPGQVAPPEADFEFATNPMYVLRDLYHFLNLEPAEGKAPAEQIWDHDAHFLEEALTFYRDVSERTGVDADAAALDAFFAGPREPRLCGDEAAWTACVAAHRGFMLGVELLLILPRLAASAGFFGLGCDDRLAPTVPAVFRDPEQRAALMRALAPPPAASGDEIVTPTGGHFFSREAPHLPPLVREGDRVEPGQTLFIIEVMKMFNRVTATFGGTIRKVLVVEDGKIVKKGQPIFKVEPDEGAVPPTSDTSAGRAARALALMRFT